VYDPVGNRTLLLSNGAPTTSTYNAGNELLTSQTSAGVTTSTYDGNGNLLTTQAPANQLTTNTWDGENRLTRVSLSSGVLDTFTYNGDGQRVQKQDSTGTTNHAWDGQNILLETNASNIIQVVYTLEPAFYGNLISQSRGGTDSFYLFDALGSTRQLSSSAGSVTDSYLYDSFGNILAASGSTTNWFRYVGKLGYCYDLDTSKFYLRARFYDPNGGRFLSRDPLGTRGAANRYAYLRSTPTLDADPSGMQPCAQTYWTQNSCSTCPPCPCSDTRTAKDPTQGYPIGEAGQSICSALRGNAARCDITFKIADCGAGEGVSWTCPQGNVKGKRKLWVCISQDLNQCQIMAILYHECTHANYFCNQPSGRPAGISSLKDCRAQENVAYENSCAEAAKLDCVPVERLKQYLKNCVNTGVDKISCNPKDWNPNNPSPVNPCKNDLPRVFPESQGQVR
jgi:RHS repeat-associated protein